MIATEHISIFFLRSSKIVHYITKIMNKSQPDLNNTYNMTNRSRKEAKNCNIYKKSFSHIEHSTLSLLDLLMLPLFKER